MKLINQKSQSSRASFAQNGPTKGRQVYRYEAGWLVSNSSWLNHGGSSLCLALSSFIESYSNYVQLVTLDPQSPVNEIEPLGCFSHPYPTTKIAWNPSENKRLLATSADYLRIWSVQEPSSKKLKEAHTYETDPKSLVNLQCLLRPSDDSRYCSPLTSFDWNEVDTGIIITSSLDSTCVLWDINSQRQISSHHMTTYFHKSSNELSSKSVYDVAFSRLGSGKDLFYSAVADGSIRSYDTRLKTPPTTLFNYSTCAKLQSSSPKPLVRVCCNRLNPNLLSALALESDEILLLDVRNTREPVALLRESGNVFNCIDWAPHLPNYICSGSSNNKVLIWDLDKTSVDSSIKPVLAYQADSGVNVINWSLAHPDWISIGFGNSLELLRV